MLNLLPRRLTARGKLGWQALPPAAQLYVVIVMAAGAGLVTALFPVDYPRPLLFVALLVTSCFLSAWKVTLLLPLSSGSTLSVSYAANIMALLLLSPREALIVAVAGAWTQCTFNVRQPYPWYRTSFSMAAEAVTIQATAAAYFWLGGLSHPVAFDGLLKPIVGAIGVYFVVNTGLVAGAIGLSTRQNVWTVWRSDFLWSAPSFIVAGSAGAIAVVVLERGDQWLGILMMAPVYLTYRTYQVFLGRIEDEQRHLTETRKLHTEAVEALMQARRAEQALEHEKERLAVTLRSIGDGVITTDLSGRITLFNSVAEALTGWSHDQAIGTPLATVLHNLDPGTREPCDNSVEALTRGDQPPVTRATVLIARDNSERPIEEVSAPLRDVAGRTIGVVVAFRDMTEALKMQEERVRTERIASLGLLAGGIAHDFNNILMAITGHVSLARATVSSINPASSSLAEAEQACVRARQLTWQLLSFSKGGVPVKRETAIGPMLKESASLALRGTNVDCKWQLAPELWSVRADESQIVQVFNNVLINARQAISSEGTIEIRAENVFEPSQRWEHALSVEPGPYVRVSISDTGVGIPHEHLSRIFDPFFSTKESGCGLGLASSYSIIKNHGGFVSVESKVECGTTITVNLPASVNREIAAEAETIRTLSRGKRVLVMDDEASIRSLAVSMLKHLGHDAEVVSDGSAAVERYRSALKHGVPYAAVILDLMVPGGMGARETMELLTEMDPSVNAIVVSGYARDSVMLEFKDHGFKAMIGKPFTLDELSKTLKSIIPTERIWTVH